MGQLRWGLLLSLVGVGCAGGSKDSADEHTGHLDTGMDTDSELDTDSEVDTDTEPPADDELYAFPGRQGGESSVSYSGQSFRHLLIHDLGVYLDDLTARIDGGSFPKPGETTADLEFYFDFEDAFGGVEHDYSSDPGPLQQTYSDVSEGKDLVGKVAGNDAEGQHEDWSKALVGWEVEGVDTPESLVRHWFDRIDELAVDRAGGDVVIGPDGQPAATVYLTPEGHDLSQLIEKFLLGAIAFSQAADDYMDDETEGKGLLASNEAPEEGEYTDLEHAWDEGFGYFGAARDYPVWGADLVADVGYADSYAPDGSIDLLSEVCWGASTNAAKRDRGAVVPTDFMGEAWTGFWEGRALIASVDGPLSEDQLDELRVHRDLAVGAWEAAIAATMVHYVNDTLQDMATFATEDYDFADHAKHWSELKGFAFTPQFNPHSPMSDSDVEELHALIGQAPVLPTADAKEIEAYRADLLAARALIGAAYGFAEDNLGDDNGEDGW